MIGDIFDIIFLVVVMVIASSTVMAFVCKQDIKDWLFPEKARQRKERQKQYKVAKKLYDSHMRENFPNVVTHVEFERFLKRGILPSHFINGVAQLSSAQES